MYGDGTQTRSFTYVGDVVEGLMRLMAAPAAIGEVFNIGNVEEISILALAERIRTMDGQPVADRARSLRGSVRRRVRRHAAARAGAREDPRTRRLRPTVDLDEILTRVIAHERATLDG